MAWKEWHALIVSGMPVYILGCLFTLAVHAVEESPKTAEL